MIDTVSLRSDAVKFVDHAMKMGTWFNAEDDPDFWRIALSVVMRDAAHLIEEQPSGSQFYLELGSCSHWRRPHQTRWTADGGFAWPSGYNGIGFSDTGIPQMDWWIGLKWYRQQQVWGARGPRDGQAKRKFVLRVALPARTARHHQAAVNAIWLYGTPNEPRKKSLTMYGFRKTEGLWHLTAWTEWEDARHWR
jgi:hypothetical protein